MIEDLEKISEISIEEALQRAIGGELEELVARGYSDSEIWKRSAQAEQYYLCKLRAAEIELAQKEANLFFAHNGEEAKAKVVEAHINRNPQIIELNKQIAKYKYMAKLSDSLKTGIQFKTRLIEAEAKINQEKR